MLKPAADKGLNSGIKVNNGTNWSSVDNDPIADPSTNESRSSANVSSSASASTATDSSLKLPGQIDEGAGVGADAQSLPMSEHSKDERPSFNITNSLNITTQVPSVNDSRINSSATTMRRSSVEGTIASTSRTNSSSPNSSMTMAFLRYCN